nr:MAG TPA: hypothetical protein [Inoviridae sp.]
MHVTANGYIGGLQKAVYFFLGEKKKNVDCFCCSCYCCVLHAS